MTALVFPVDDKPFTTELQPGVFLHIERVVYGEQPYVCRVSLSPSAKPRDQVLLAVSIFPSGRCEWSQLQHEDQRPVTWAEMTGPDVDIPLPTFLPVAPTATGLPAHLQASLDGWLTANGRDLARWLVAPTTPVAGTGTPPSAPATRSRGR